MLTSSVPVLEHDSPRDVDDGYSKLSDPLESHHASYPSVFLVLVQNMLPSPPRYQSLNAC